jgi:oligopeptide transport system permease protein
MFAFILRRIFWAVPVIFFVSLVTFFLMHQAPGGPFDREDKRVDARTLAALNARFGLDKPQYVNPARVSALWSEGVRNPFTLGRAYLDSQYGNYMLNALTGDLGPSYRQRGKDVQDILRTQWPYSLRLGLMALTFAVIVGIPLGVLAALKQNTVIDYISLFFATVGISVPTFVTGLLVIIVFGTTLNWISITTNDWNTWRPYIAPALVLGLSTMSFMTRITRTTVLEVKRQDYIRTARAAPYPAQRADPRRDGPRPNAGRPRHRRGDHRDDLRRPWGRQLLRRLDLPARLFHDYGNDADVRGPTRAS